MYNDTPDRHVRMYISCVPHYSVPLIYVLEILHGFFSRMTRDFIIILPFAPFTILHPLLINYIFKPPLHVHQSPPPPPPCYLT